MNIAKLIKTLPVTEAFAKQALYKVSPAIEGYEHVVASGISNIWGTETYLFGANESGEIVVWSELPGSIRGVVDHEAAFDSIDYKIEY